MMNFECFDLDYSEKYYNFSEEPSNGETSFNKPILQKNYMTYKNLNTPNTFYLTNFKLYYF